MVTLVRFVVLMCAKCLVARLRWPHNCNRRDHWPMHSSYKILIDSRQYRWPMQRMWTNNFRCFPGMDAGIGLGFIYLPAMVMVGYYFDRRRALALGITCSGGGAGLLVIAPVSAFLLSEFDWKNSCLLMAAFPLQVRQVWSRERWHCNAFYYDSEV